MVYMQSDLPFCMAAEPLTLTQFIPDCCLEKGTLNGIVTNPGSLAERFTPVTRLHANSTHGILHAAVPLRVRFTGDRKACRCLNEMIRWQPANSSMPWCTDDTLREDVVSHLPLKRKNMHLNAKTS